MVSDPAEVLTILEKAIAGLQWMSESDYPFEVFHWQDLTSPDLTNEQLLQRTHHEPGTPVETVSLDTLFAIATQEQDWQGAEEKQMVHQYRVLVDTLKQQLTEIKIYRVGSRVIDIYIVGKTTAGNIVGLSTKAVET